MKIVQINSTCGIGSTGKICVGISEVLSEKDIENYILYSAKSNGYSLGIPCSDDPYIKIQALKSRVFGNYGFNSQMATHRIINTLNSLQPDIVHLHNIHGHDCDLKTLFTYLKKQKVKLLWTFHDCWAFTGYCPHFTMLKCEKWKTACSCCPRKRDYSWIHDRSDTVFEKKKQLFSGLDMTIVTPSVWLADLVKQSFLKNYPIKVINNGIDLNFFCPTESDFKKRYDISEEKKILLGVAFDWGVRKGQDVFIELSKRLDSKRYQIVLVGINESLRQQLPSNVIAIHRTNNQSELAEIYTAADLFLNPTREENFPTVNIEALACGTPVLTFRTGGSPEILDETCGSVVECDDIDALEREIVRICTDKPYTKAACIQRASEFGKKEKFGEYLELYKEVFR